MEGRLTTRVAVFVIVRNDKGEMLLQRRSPGLYLGDHWDFPSGHGEFNESIRESAVRELKEEVDLTGRAEDLRLVHVDQYFVEVNYINFVFELDTWSGTPKICEPDKCSAIGWFAEGLLPEKCVNVVRATEAAGFGNELTYSVTDKTTCYDLLGLPKQAI
jgi:8-oxo-dGTP diphosphatase